MSQPKHHCEGQHVHLCRRVTQHRFLLRNDKSGDTKNDAGYIFGLAARKCGQDPHAVMTMSNHVHIFQTDTTGKRSKFMQLFHGLLAKVINRRLNRSENLWSSQEPGNTWVLDTEKIVETLVYIWLNPVRANLVERVSTGITS